MFEINDELKQIQNEVVNSQIMTNNTQSNFNKSSINLNRPFSTKSNRTNNTLAIDMSLKDALFNQKYQVDADQSTFPLIEKKDYTKTIQDFERNINTFDKDRKKKVEQNVKKLKDKLKESVKEKKLLGKDNALTFYTSKNDVFESSIKKVRCDILKRKSLSNYNSHTRINHSILNITNDSMMIDNMNNNQENNDEINVSKKNKKVYRPETAKVLKVNDNFKDIDKLDKFQLETEVP